MKLTASQLRKIIAEEIKRTATAKQLNEYGMGSLASVSQIETAKAALSVFIDQVKTAAEDSGDYSDPGEVQDAVHSALDELMEEAFSEAGFEEMPPGYYRG